MSDFFDTLLTVSGGVHDAFYGEQFLIEPQAPPTGPNNRPDPNARMVADPARPAKTITGVWSEPHKTVHPTNRTGHATGQGAAFGDDKPMLDFETSALPYDLRIKDFVTRVKTGERFAVSDAGDDGFTRTMASLTAARGRL